MCKHDRLVGTCRVCNTPVDTIWVRGSSEDENDDDPPPPPKRPRGVGGAAGASSSSRAHTSPRRSRRRRFAPPPHSISALVAISAAVAAAAVTACVSRVAKGKGKQVAQGPAVDSTDGKHRLAVSMCGDSEGQSADGSSRQWHNEEGMLTDADLPVPAPGVVFDWRVHQMHTGHTYSSSSQTHHAGAGGYGMDGPSQHFLRDTFAEAPPVAHSTPYEDQGHADDVEGDLAQSAHLLTLDRRSHQPPPSSPSAQSPLDPPLVDVVHSAINVLQNWFDNDEGLQDCGGDSEPGRDQLYRAPPSGA